MPTAERQLETTASISPYQIDKGLVDVAAMSERAEARLIRLRRHALKEILRSPVWGKEYPSVDTFHLRTQYRDYSKGCLSPDQRIYPLEPNTGAINVPESSLQNSELGSFFNPLRVKKEGCFVQLRRSRYYAAADHSKNTPEKKLAVMNGDINEGLELIDSTDRSTLSGERLLLYLGILDHLKTHTLTAFHALTYHEREGVISEDQEYMPIRQLAQDVSTTLTRAYYQACLGRSFDAGFKSAEIKKALEIMGDYIVNSRHTAAHFTLPEVINPLTIILGAHEVARRRSCPDILIGIPSGGSEPAIATRLMYEILYPDLHAPDAEFVQLSYHFHAQGGMSLERLVEMLARLKDLRGKRVLIVDDNSNTGSTLQLMSDAVIRSGASKIQAHLAEIDTARVKARDKTGNFPFGVVNLDHPDFETAMGTSGASDADGSDSRRKRIMKLIKEAHKIEKGMIKELRGFL